jgi:hypothetical protein
MTKSVPSNACHLLNNIPGYPSQRSLMVVACFFSPIFSYFCLLVAKSSYKRFWICEYARRIFASRSGKPEFPTPFDWNLFYARP